MKSATLLLSVIFVMIGILAVAPAGALPIMETRDLTGVKFSERAGEPYVFTGDLVSVPQGAYNFTMTGKVADDVDSWEGLPDDRILFDVSLYIEATAEFVFIDLPDFVGESTPDVRGNGPYEISFDFILPTDGDLLILAFPDTSISREYFTVNSAVLASVPEPTTLLLVGAGLLGLVGIGRQRLKRT